MSGACLGTGWRERCEGREGGRGTLGSVDGCGPFAVSTALIFYTCGGAACGVEVLGALPPEGSVADIRELRSGASSAGGRAYSFLGKNVCVCALPADLFFMHILDGSRSFFIFTYRRFKPPHDTDRQPNLTMGAAGHSVNILIKEAFIGTGLGLVGAIAWLVSVTMPVNAKMLAYSNKK